jgi:NAD(P)H dehydrogenase (quinone)
MSKILVTGATGHLGTAVINHLLTTGDSSDIVALVRDDKKANSLKERGVETRVGTFDDPHSLDKALGEVSKILLISTGDPNRFRQHQNLIDAAKKAGTSYVAYTGVSLKDLHTSSARFLLESHYQTEDYIKASGFAYTFFRNNIYADMLLAFLGDQVLEKGISLAAGEGKLPFALRREMGEAFANVLRNTEPHQNQTYEIANTELYSFNDIAETLSQLSGKAVTYTDTDPVEFENILRERHLPAHVISIFSAFVADFKNHQYETTSNDLEKLLGRKPASLYAALKELYKL